jgi:hypothetical protein
MELNPNFTYKRKTIFFARSKIEFTYLQILYATFSLVLKVPKFSTEIIKFTHVKAALVMLSHIFHAVV